MYAPIWELRSSSTVLPDASSTSWRFLGVTFSFSPGHAAGVIADQRWSSQLGARMAYDFGFNQYGVADACSNAVVVRVQLRRPPWKAVVAVRREILRGRC